MYREGIAMTIHIGKSIKTIVFARLLAIRQGRPNCLDLWNQHSKPLVNSIDIERQTHVVWHGKQMGNTVANVFMMGIAWVHNLWMMGKARSNYRFWFWIVAGKEIRPNLLPAVSSLDKFLVDGSIWSFRLIKFGWIQLISVWLRWWIRIDFPLLGGLAMYDEGSSRKTMVVVNITSWTSNFALETFELLFTEDPAVLHVPMVILPQEVTPMKP